MTVENVVAVLIGVVWLGAIVALIAWATGRAGKRALRQKHGPVRLLPWYLGGPPKVHVEHPPDVTRRRDRDG